MKKTTLAKEESADCESLLAIRSLLDSEISDPGFGLTYFPSIWNIEEKDLPSWQQVLDSENARNSLVTWTLLLEESTGLYFADCNPSLHDGEKNNDPQRNSDQCFEGSR